MSTYEHCHACGARMTFQEAYAHGYECIPCRTSHRCKSCTKPLGENYQQYGCLCFECYMYRRGAN